MLLFGTIVCMCSPETPYCAFQNEKHVVTKYLRSLTQLVHMHPLVGPPFFQFYRILVLNCLFWTFLTGVQSFLETFDSAELETL